MKLSKILATSTIIGLTCTAALADNSINFSQSDGSINTVKFTQTGGGSISIGSNGTPSSVTGSLDTLSIEQIGGGRQRSQLRNHDGYHFPISRIRTNPRDRKL